MARAAEIWFVTGSQQLYGAEALQTVAKEARKIAAALAAAQEVGLAVKTGPVVTTAEAIASVCRDANDDRSCAGLIFWMHTFPPANMWVRGLLVLEKPVLHFHTQPDRDVSRSSTDTNSMDLNQSAQGGRGFGFTPTRGRTRRAVVVGHWTDKRALAEIGEWTRAVRGLLELRTLKIARFSDTTRQVPATSHDKVNTPARFGHEVNEYAIGDLADRVADVSDQQVDALLEEYATAYEISTELGARGDKHESLRAQAQIEAGIRGVLDEGGYRAFTTIFEDVHGLAQLPGLAVQRLMEAGYGFAAEGDWATAALIRAMKIMGEGLPGGTSFVEDHTYIRDPSGNLVLGAHMLEVCPSIAHGKPHMEVPSRSIGGMPDSARLVFSVAPGPAINAAVVEDRGRFRMVVNEIAVVAPPEDMPRLPVARVLWEAHPDQPTASACWTLSGGTHHTGFSTSVSTSMLELIAEMLDIELMIIDRETTKRGFRKELRWNEAWFRVGSDGRI